MRGRDVTDPFPFLATVIGVFRHSEKAPGHDFESRLNLEEAAKFLAERLKTVALLAEMKIQGKEPILPLENDVEFVNGFDFIPKGDRGKRVQVSPVTLLHDVAKGLGRRVPLTKLVELDQDIRPYLASLLIAAMARAGDSLTIPDNLTVHRLSAEEFRNFLEHQAGK